MGTVCARSAGPSRKGPLGGPWRLFGGLGAEPPAWGLGREPQGRPSERSEGLSHPFRMFGCAAAVAASVADRTGGEAAPDG